MVSLSLLEEFRFLLIHRINVRPHCPVAWSGQSSLMRIAKLAPPKVVALAWPCAILSQSLRVLSGTAVSPGNGFPLASALPLLVSYQRSYEHLGNILTYFRLGRAAQLRLLVLS